MSKTTKYNGTFNGTVVPMFLPTQMEQPMPNTKDKTQNNDPMPSDAYQQAELSVFDVKELYDLAHSYKANDDAKFKTIMAEAVKLDMQYRRQIEQKSPYKNSTEAQAHKDKITNAA